MFRLPSDFSILSPVAQLSRLSTLFRFRAPAQAESRLSRLGPECEDSNETEAAGSGFRTRMAVKMPNSELWPEHEDSEVPEALRAGLERCDIERGANQFARSKLNS
jgi:hypothetical protein